MFEESESVGLLREIRDVLTEINDKLIDISVELEAVRGSVDDIKGKGIYSIDDIHSKLADLEISIDMKG